jgi:hypothetical protein
MKGMVQQQATDKGKTNTLSRAKKCIYRGESTHRNTLYTETHTLLGDEQKRNK